MKSYLLARISEPSTWRGLVMLLTAAGVQMAPPLQDAIITAGIGIAGIIGAVMPDK